MGRGDEKGIGRCESKIGVVWFYRGGGGGVEFLFAWD